MAVVQEAEDVVLGGVVHVELVGAHGVGFQADAEDLGLHGVTDVLGVQLFGENLVQGVFQPLTGPQAVGGDVLIAVGDPNVVERELSQLFSEILGNLPAAFAVLHPEMADGFVRIGQGQAVGGFRMGEQRGIEVQSQSPVFRKIHPCGEVLRL